MLGVVVGGEVDSSTDCLPIRSFVNYSTSILRSSEDIHQEGTNGGELIVFVLSLLSQTSV